MGMFDYIYSEYNLPLPEPEIRKEFKFNNPHTFQTKDLDNSLGAYRIDKDGQLWIEAYETKIVPGDENSISIFGRLSSVEQVKNWWVEHNITQSIEFYDYYTNDDNEYDYIITYVGIFINGKLVKIDLIEFTAESNALRKQQQAAYFQQMKEYHEFTKTKKFKYIYKPYNKSVRFVFRHIHKLVQFIIPLLNKLEKWLTL